MLTTNTDEQKLRLKNKLHAEMPELDKRLGERHSLSWLQESRIIDWATDFTVRAIVTHDDELNRKLTKTIKAYEIARMVYVAGLLCFIVGILVQIPSATQQPTGTLDVILKR